jgi:hypothetical protein
LTNPDIARQLVLSGRSPREICFGPWSSPGITAVGQGRNSKELLERPCEVTLVEEAGFVGDARDGVI